MKKKNLGNHPKNTFTKFLGNLTIFRYGKKGTKVVERIRRSSKIGR